MKNSMFHSKRFWIGLSFFVGLVLASFLFTWYGKDLYSQTQVLIKDADGNVTQTAPFNPLWMPPFGSDRSGYNLLFKLLTGAKFTILFVFGICFIQLFVGTLLGSLLAYTPHSVQKLIEKVCKVYFYVPTVVLVIVFMLPLMIKSEQTGFQESIVIKQFLILCIVTLPNLILYISKEINLFMKKDYITSTIVLGATKVHVFRKHIWPFLKEILIILFLQQAVQLFTLLIHMGFFKVLIGGRKMVQDHLGEPPTAFSFTNEWSGLIGLTKNELLTAPWIILAPLVAFSISIFVLNFMIQGIKEQHNTRFMPTPQKKQDSIVEERKIEMSVDKFRFASMKPLYKGEERSYE
ncbi:TPA: ABC transporter permease subunit [Bacillus pseudomycoides]|nr:ABC transporter permease subunit [Bacillus pseudomycoides]